MFDDICKTNDNYFQHIFEYRVVAFQKLLYSTLNHFIIILMRLQTFFSSVIHLGQTIYRTLRALRFFICLGFIRSLSPNLFYTSLLLLHFSTSNIFAHEFFSFFKEPFTSSMSYNHKRSVSINLKWASEFWNMLPIIIQMS